MTHLAYLRMPNRPNHAVVELIGNRVLVYIPGSESTYLIHSALLSDSGEVDKDSVLERLFSTSWGRKLFTGFPALSPRSNQSPECWNDPGRVDGIELFLTDRCNLACRYCLAHGKDNVGTELEAEDILRACEPYLRTPRPVNITFSGGEPLLRFNVIRELINRLRHSECYSVGQIRLITNLVLMDREMAEFLAKHAIIVSVSVHSNEIIGCSWWENRSFVHSLEVMREEGCIHGGFIFVVDSKQELQRVCQMPLEKLRRYTEYLLVPLDLTQWPDDLSPEFVAQQLLHLRRRAMESGLRLTGWWDRPVRRILEGKTDSSAWCPGISGGGIAIWPDGRSSRCRYLRPSEFIENVDLKRKLVEMENAGLTMRWDLVTTEQLYHMATKGCDSCWLLSICAGCCSLTWPEKNAGDDRRCRFLREITRLLLVERARSAILGREIHEAIVPLGRELL